jgi:hypothetical protein
MSDGFARAQREWENASPPDWTGEVLAVRTCDHVRVRVVTNSLGFDVDYDDECGWQGEAEVSFTSSEEEWCCPECGHVHRTRPSG